MEAFDEFDIISRCYGEWRITENVSGWVKLPVRVFDSNYDRLGGVELPGFSVGPRLSVSSKTS